MYVCIVGGTGNISTDITRLLLEQGHEVTCFNRGQSRDVPEGARLITGDRKDRDAFEAAMQKEQFDAAIDMICFNQEDAESDIRAFRDVGHFVQCSTVMTYGKPDAFLPVTEDHPIRPNTPYGVGKAEADAAFMVAHYSDGFPVTVIKPSVTHGPVRGLVRQVSRGFEWIDRIRKGKPLTVCGDGRQLIQFLYVKDAAPGFAGVLGKSHTVGQTYNLVERGCIEWRTFHQTAMQVIGREVELVGVPFDTLETLDIPEFRLCQDVYSHNNYFSAEKLFRDVPEFRPQTSLADAMEAIIAGMDAAGRIPDSDALDWEDKVIAAQKQVRYSV